MKIFITGGTGFIGRPVVRRLQQANHQLLVLTKQTGSAKMLFGSSKNIKLIHGSLSGLKRVEPTIQRFRPDLAIHLAWEGIPDYGVSMSAKNLAHGVNLIEMLSRLSCPTFIGAGSCWEYGATVGKINEKTLPQSTNSFTAAKLSLKLFGEQVAANSNIKFIWPRFFYVYGPGQKPISLIPAVINSAKSGRLIELKNPNGGNDFVYVDDVAEAIALIVKKIKTIPAGVYNVGSGNLSGVRQIVNIALKHFNLATKFPSAKRRPVGFYADISKLSKATGWRPKTTLEQGIKQTIAYFQETK